MRPPVPPACPRHDTASLFFFFQAEDGIRDYKVTGVQTCALPICRTARPRRCRGPAACPCRRAGSSGGDRKSTRLNSSHLVISYAVFCLKKKKHTAGPAGPTLYPSTAGTTVHIMTIVISPQRHS